jgi:hypothetical protein
MVAVFGDALHNAIREYQSILFPNISAQHKEQFEAREEVLRLAVQSLYEPAGEYNNARRDLRAFLYATTEHELLSAVVIDILRASPDFSAPLGTYCVKSVTGASQPRPYGLVLAQTTHNNVPAVDVRLFADVPVQDGLARKVLDHDGLLEVVSCKDDERYLKRESLGLLPEDYESHLTRLITATLPRLRNATGR